ncbi:MAG: CAP domain-containing protein, partial [Chloroflexota bacterium]
YNFRTTTAFIPLIFILFLGITLVPAAPALAGPAEDMLALVNRERARAGLSPVTLCPQLTTAARVHVNDMIANDFFSHTGSDGSRSWDRIGRAGYQWRTTGENLAYEYGTASATNIFNMWMGSSGHRANILNSSVQHMGLYTGSVMEGSWRKHYWVQTFGASNTTCQNTVAPGVTVSPSQAVTMEENETINYTIRLTTPPSAPVTIRARTSSDACWVGGSPAVLNANNYNTGVTFRVKAVIDDIIEPDEACNLWTLDPQSSDPTYDALTMRDTPNRLITVRDNDEPRIVITPARRVNLSETGAQSQTYTVKLLARPTANVRFALRTSSNQCTLSTSQ